MLVALCPSNTEGGQEGRRAQARPCPSCLSRLLYGMLDTVSQGVPVSVPLPPLQVSVPVPRVR